MSSQQLFNEYVREVDLSIKLRRCEDCSEKTWQRLCGFAGHNRRFRCMQCKEENTLTLWEEMLDDEL